jgi:hypothetical protein
MGNLVSSIKVMNNNLKKHHMMKGSSKKRFQAK